MCGQNAKSVVLNLVTTKLYGVNSAHSAVFTCYYVRQTAFSCRCTRFNIHHRYRLFHNILHTLLQFNQKDRK